MLAADPDLEKAELIIFELSHAQEEPPGRSLKIVLGLLEQVEIQGSRGIAIESARADAIVALGQVAAYLRRDGICIDDHWHDAVRLTRIWRALLI